MGVALRGCFFAMLRAAVRTPLRFTTPGNSWNGLRPPVKRNFQTARPRRAGAPPEGDGISHNIQYTGLWGAITTFPKRKPFATNIIVATVKTAIADLIVQKSVEKKEEI